MKIIDNNLKISAPDYNSIIPNGSSYVFFDIETTGLSRRSSVIYLSGFVYASDGVLKAQQFLLDSLEDEKDLVEKTIQFLNTFDYVITFNGDNFDIPMLKERMKFHGIHEKINFDQLDIFKMIRPYKSFLGLDSMKQKSIEAFLNISRKDEMSGGELIKIFFYYLKIHDAESYDLLLQHNFDDICGMPALMDILKYPSIFEHVQRVECAGLSQDTLSLQIKLNEDVPVPINYENEDIEINIASSTLEIVVPVLKATLYHYFSNYKDYYYLPAEDTAIHRSVAEFVDSSAKVKAKASNCYVKRSGVFLPQFDEPVFTPDFRTELHDKNTYFEIKEDIIEDKETLNSYLNIILKHLRP
ncbi:MAG: ribonuclease H-like domain-containing protein [Lachnospiraceae bacterium]|nr:ribonuclease H-like domain-containing protein [Lachnospiraceae bacterium]